MKETIDQMRDRHKKEIEDLQDNCKHEKISGWMEEMWAPGHFSGTRVKVCEVCGKVVERTPRTNRYFDQAKKNI